MSDITSDWYVNLTESTYRLGPRVLKLCLEVAEVFDSRVA